MVGAGAGGADGPLFSFSAFKVTRIVSCFNGTAEVTSGRLEFLGAGAPLGLGGVGAEGTGGVVACGPVNPVGADFKVTRTVSFLNGTAEVFRIGLVFESSLFSSLIL